MGAAGMMLAGQGASAGAGFLSAVGQARALRAQGRYESRAARLNAEMAGRQAEDALRRGGLEEAAQRRRARSLAGTQRVALAAQGIDLSEGSSGDILRETTALGALDALTIRNNAFREAFGYRVAASEATSRARMARISSRAQARSTLITGGLQAAQKFGAGLYEYGRRT